MEKIPEEENTWKPLFAIQHLKMLIDFFYKKYPEKPLTTFLPINSTLPIASLMLTQTRLTTKRKRGQPANGVNK